MLFIGYFEGLDSQRGIAWRCADSLGLRTFLGIGLTEATPVHASMTIIRQRLPQSVFDEVFGFVLGLLQTKGLLRGQTLGIPPTASRAAACAKECSQPKSLRTRSKRRERPRGLTPMPLGNKRTYFLVLVFQIRSLTLTSPKTHHHFSVFLRARAEASFCSN